MYYSLIGRYIKARAEEKTKIQSKLYGIYNNYQPESS